MSMTLGWTLVLQQGMWLSVSVPSSTSPFQARRLDVAPTLLRHERLRVLAAKNVKSHVQSFTTTTHFLINSLCGMAKATRLQLQGADKFNVNCEEKLEMLLSSVIGCIRRNM